MRPCVVVALVLFACSLIIGTSSSALHLNIVSLNPSSSPLLRLAGRDAHRYLRLLACGSGNVGGDQPCSVTTSLREVDSAAAHLLDPETLFPPGGVGVGVGVGSVLVAVREDLPDSLLLSLSASSDLAALEGDAYLVRAVTLLPPPTTNASLPTPTPPHRVTVCTGATPRAALYAIYRGLLRHLGARFYLHGDVLPSPHPSRALRLVHSADSNAAHPGLDAAGAPRFLWRGIQPFHDFPMGPDWWSLDFWRGLETQLAKAGQNFVGLHTYPISGPTEPAVFVGAPGSFSPLNGSVADWAAYPTSWYLTQNFSRGNLPGSVSRATSAYAAGAALLFPRDCYGSPAQAETCFPQTTADEVAVLDASAALLRDAFAWGRTAAGVDAAVGTEMPISRPANGPAQNATLQELYEGIFGRLVASGVAEDSSSSSLMYWLWTTEAVEDHSTGKGYPQSNPLWGQLTDEIAAAVAARDAVAPNLTLGSNGWCLGPGDNSSYFDAVISDPGFVLASIDPLLGWAPVDPGFADVTRHRSIVIPWMEDDMGLAGAELFVNRTLWHAADAAAYNATGLLGLLWRTYETVPQLAALADAGWNETSPVVGLTAEGVYLDFCAANFGADTADECASLFLALDGTSDPTSPDMANSLLPRGGQGCCGGPLGPTGEEGPVRFLNTTGIESWLSTVTGAANVQRAQAWAGVYLYHSAMAGVSVAGQALAQAAALVHDEATAREFGFPALAGLSWAYTDMLTALLGFAQSPGELGMLAAHEGMNWPGFFSLAAPVLPYMSRCAATTDPTASACLPDGNWSGGGGGRAYPYTVTLSDPGNTREWCGAQCVAAGYAWAGVEFGVACFCGGEQVPAGVVPLPLSACVNMTCAGAPDEFCGGPDILSVFPAACPPTPGLPPDLLPPTTFQGPARLFPTVVRTVVGEAEGFVVVEVAVLAAAQPDAVELTWWTVPSSASAVVAANTTVAMTAEGVGRGLYTASVPVPTVPTDVLEYVVGATWTAGGTGPLVWPVEGAQSVVFV
jgi:hypothetical protein